MNKYTRNNGFQEQNQICGNLVPQGQVKITGLVKTL